MCVALRWSLSLPLCMFTLRWSTSSSDVCCLFVIAVCYSMFRLISAILPLVYGETHVRKELIKSVQMGPFTHKVDHGLDARKVNFEPSQAFGRLSMIIRLHLSASPRYWRSFLGRWSLLMFLTRFCWG